MRFIIFCLLASFCLCLGQNYFRFSNGTFTKGNKSPITISGSLDYSLGLSSAGLWLYGMDYSTMTPIYFTAWYDMLTTASEISLDCKLGKHGLENDEKLSGKVHLRPDGDRCELSAECYTQTGDLWTFNSSNVKTKRWYYSQKEAGFRAKFLIGQPRSKYKPQDVIHFALVDYPYHYGNCENFLNWYSNAPGPEYMEG